MSRAVMPGGRTRLPAAAVNALAEYIDVASRGQEAAPCFE